jgi:hypothetical protein
MRIQTLLVITLLPVPLSAPSRVRAGRSLVVALR